MKFSSQLRDDFLKIGKNMKFSNSYVKFSQKYCHIHLKIACNSLKKWVKSHKSYVKITVKLCEILLKIASDSLENCVKFFLNRVKFY